VQNGEVVFVRNGQTTPILPVAEVKIQGTHNLSNALAGACAAILGGAALADVADVLRVFEGVADRQEIIREIDEVTYVNDTTATAPDAVVPALERFGKEKKVILIAGGVDKKLSYTRMCEGIVTYAKHLILFPGTASDIIEPAVLGKVKIEHAHSMAEAVKKAAALAERGDTVLLSPGGSSFNMFKNEFDRGDQFREEVRNL
jgi:UDP-N-acetylmuramoylalanine--D-glutamate ligase